MAPTLFGFPLWEGRIRKRVAKKYLNRRTIGYLYRRYRTHFANAGVGTIINDCSGFNGDVINITPYYWRAPGGDVLGDIDFTTTNTGCSLIHCGIEPELPREEVEARHLQYLEGWFFGEGGRMWFGDLSDPKNKDEVDLANLKLEVLKSGGHITDEHGRLLPEFSPLRFSKTWER